MRRVPNLSYPDIYPGQPYCIAPRLRLMMMNVFDIFALLKVMVSKRWAGNEPLLKELEPAEETLSAFLAWTISETSHVPHNKFLLSSVPISQIINISSMTRNILFSLFWTIDDFPKTSFREVSWCVKQHRSVLFVGAKHDTRNVFETPETFQMMRF